MNPNSNGWMTDCRPSKTHETAPINNPRDPRRAITFPRGGR